MTDTTQDMTDANIEEVVAQYNEAKAQYDEACKLIADRGAEVLHLGFQKLFAEHPKLKAIQFKAYAPYFNDGEACVWGVRGVYTGVDITDPIVASAKYGPTEECDEGDQRIAWFDGWSSNNDKDSVDALAYTIEQKVNAMQQTIKDCLGEEHMQVIVTPAGMVVEEYGDHD